LHAKAPPLVAASARHRPSYGRFPCAFAVDVLDDLLAPLVLEIDVDVGRLVALGADEAAEQQRRAPRVDLGDAEPVAHQRVGRAAAALAQDALRARPVHDVGNGDEVRLVLQAFDQRQFLVERAPVRRRHAGRKAPQEPLLDQRVHAHAAGGLPLSAGCVSCSSA
jgi:hypothetical protein